VVGLNVLIAAPILLLTAPVVPWLNLLIIAAALTLTVALGVFCWNWPLVEHRWTSYRVVPLGIEIRRGVLWRKIITVPRSRVQHTDVSQGPIERRFALGTLHIFTAGTEHSKVELPGLTHVNALMVRDHLVKAGQDDAV
jgi:membrane protein YdbS with pleckstrin-like domain